MQVQILNSIATILEFYNFYIYILMGISLIT